MVPTHPNSFSARDSVSARDRLGIRNIHQARALVVSVAGLAALPVCGSLAHEALGAVTGEPCTAMLLSAVLLFALIAGAVTGLLGVACGLGELLEPSDRP